MQRGIFISYRRDTGSTMARMVYDRLRLERKYQCFLDVEKLNAGNFRENISAEMDKCDVFLLILSRGALNRCENPNDNVRQEILAALEKGLAVIPVTAEDFFWPDTMPQGIECIKDFNAIPYVQVYSEQFFERLYSFIDTVRAEEHARGSAIWNSGRAAGKTAPASGTDRSPKKTLSAVLIIVAAVAATAAIAVIAFMLGKGRNTAEKNTPAAVSLKETRASAESAQDESSVPDTSSEAQNELTAAANSFSEESILPNTDVDSAVLIPLETKILAGVKDGKYWYYTFRTADRGEYIISAVNKSGNDRLGVVLCDAGGSNLESNNAGYGGLVTSIRSELEENTDYIIKLYNSATNYYGTDPLRNPVDFALTVYNSASTANPFWGVKDSSVSDLPAGSNQDEAVMLSLDKKATGTADGGKYWYYYFQTTSASEYTIAAVNKTQKDRLGVDVIDNSGEKIGSFSASSDGTVADCSVTLQPDTIYYLRVYNNGINYTGTDPSKHPIEYRITVSAKAAKD